MFTLNEPEEMINDFLDVTEGNDKTRYMKHTCQRYKFDNIIHSKLPDNFIGHI